MKQTLRARVKIISHLGIHLGRYLNSAQSKNAQHRPGYASHFSQSPHPNLIPTCAPKCEIIFTRALRTFFSAILLAIAFTAIFENLTLASNGMVMVGTVDAYQVRMTMPYNNPPVVGSNPTVFELTDLAGNIVTDLADLGVTYELAGFLPRRIMPLSATGYSFTGTLEVYKAARYDLYFVFQRRGEAQHAVLFTFYTID